MKTWVKWLIIALIAVLFLILLIAPIFVIKHLFEIECLTKENWGEIVGGCLGYYGTIVLGIVAITQTQISLRQNTKTFIADKYSVIKLNDDCVIQTIINNKTAYENRHKYPMNQFYVSYDKKFNFNEELRLVNLVFKYDSSAYLINSLNIKSATINYGTKLFVDKKVNTALCINPSSGGQLEVVFMLTEDEFGQFNKLLNAGQLIINFTFKIISAVGVKMTENIEVNFGSVNNPIKIDDTEQNLKIEITSYNYLQGK